MAWDYAKSRAGNQGTKSATKNQTVSVSWTRPVAPWIKLNIDGASRGNLKGALQNEDGHWMGGFALNISICQHLWRSYGEFIMVFTLPGS